MWSYLRLTVALDKPFGCASIHREENGYELMSMIAHIYWLSENITAWIEQFATNNLRSSDLLTEIEWEGNFGDPEEFSH